MHNSSDQWAWHIPCQFVFTVHLVNILHQSSKKVRCFCKEATFLALTEVAATAMAVSTSKRKKERRTRSRLPTSRSCTCSTSWSDILYSAALSMIGKSTESKSQRKGSLCHKSHWVWPHNHVTRRLGWRGCVVLLRVAMILYPVLLPSAQQASHYDIGIAAYIKDLHIGSETAPWLLFVLGVVLLPVSTEQYHTILWEQWWMLGKAGSV